MKSVIQVISAMDEARNLFDYLPHTLEEEVEKPFVRFLWEVFQENYTNKHYQFAYVAYYMLWTKFVYYTIGKIRTILPEDFKKGLIGFGRDSNILSKEKPLKFTQVNDRSILQLLKLTGCTDDQIKLYNEFVTDRNKVAHASSMRKFSTEGEIDEQINSMLRAVEEIQNNTKPMITRYYKIFLHDYSNAAILNNFSKSELVEFIESNYFSLKDIEICNNFNIRALQDNNEGAIILHNTLREYYRTT